MAWYVRAASVMLCLLATAVHAVLQLEIAASMLCSAHDMCVTIMKYSN